MSLRKGLRIVAICFLLLVFMYFAGYAVGQGIAYL